MFTINPFLKKKVLVVTAHPDDEVYFAGLLHQVVESGGEVRLACATLGERGRSYLSYPCADEELKELRHSELRAAASIIGISQVYVGNLPDGALADHAEAFALQTENIAREYSPDIILGYGPEGYTGHADHIAAFTVAVALAERRSVPYVVFALPPEPYRSRLVQLLHAKRKLGVYVDVLEPVHASIGVTVDPLFKLKLLQSHASQLQGLHPHIAFGEELGHHIMKNEYFHIFA